MITTAGVDRGQPYWETDLDGALERVYFIREPQDGASHRDGCVDAGIEQTGELCCRVIARVDWGVLCEQLGRARTDQLLDVFAQAERRLLTGFGVHSGDDTPRGVAA